MIIYKATSKISNKSYIGMTTDMQVRRRSHYDNALKKMQSTAFYNAIRRHGADVWDWEILIECETREEAGKLEIKLIAEHDTYYNGYNSTHGGEGVVGYKHTDGTKRIMRQKKLGVPRSEAAKRAVSEGMKGIVFSDEHKKNLSKSRIGIVFSDEHKKNISAAQTGISRKITMVNCPYCDKQGGANIMQRWHFENCREK